MRTTLAIAFTSLLALSAPALAQSAGSPDAAGTGLTGSGTNTPGSGGGARRRSRRIRTATTA